jgi:NAD(P)-dependent dehydrogenase (short-subunit alcohol dehydrogenase family)
MVLTKDKMMKKIYMITGANRGIGLALTKITLAQGHQILATSRYRTEEEEGELKDLSQHYPGQLIHLWMDVTSDTSVKECFQAIRKKGISIIDVLINNAGVYGKDQDHLLKLSVQQMLNTFQVNTLGPMRVLQEGLPFLLKSSLGKMVSMSSQMGSIDDNRSGGSFDYRISKAALNMFHKNLSIEFPQLVSLVLHPGWVKTRMGGDQAPLSPGESAAGLYEVIEKSQLKDSGKFINYQGKVIPW